MDSSAISVYAKRLAKENFEDLISALETIAELPRKEGELAMPEVGTILALLRSAGTARRNRIKAEREYHQQQMCPKCGGIVEMMRPRGEQFRTFCAPCGAYRKIVPEDLALTEPQWRMLCAELDIMYQNWKKRGAKYSESIDPQFDRAHVLHIV